MQKEEVAKRITEIESAMGAADSWGDKDKAQAKFDHHIDPLQLSAQCLKAQELKDYPTMKIMLSEHAWQDFFVEESKLLAQSQLR